MTDGVDGKRCKVAVYGTLRKGCTNHRYLVDAKYIGTGKLPGWNLYSNGSYPYAKKSIGSITVEIYEIDEEALSGIDDLEGFPGHYERKRVNTEYGKCWLYYIDVVPSRCFKIPGGDWLDQ